MAEEKTADTAEYREFRRWFSDNYPPGVRITNPEWHALKIFRAARRAIGEQGRGLAAARDVSVDRAAACLGLPPVMYHAIVEAIEQAVLGCDKQERERIPMEARDVDYAGIVVASVEAAKNTIAAGAAVNTIAAHCEAASATIPAPADDGEEAKC